MFGWHELLIIMGIVILVFGTKKLRGMGKDLGTAVRGFRSAVNEDMNEEETLTAEPTQKQAKEQAREQIETGDTPPNGQPAPSGEAADAASDTSPKSQDP